MNTTLKNATPKLWAVMDSLTMFRRLIEQSELITESAQNREKLDNLQNRAWRALAGAAYMTDAENMTILELPENISYSKYLEVMSGKGVQS